ncbi:single-stranded-DNA-specific exonuclease RecJ, partial [bacterium]
MNKIWRTTPQNPDAADKISRGLGVSPVLGRIFAARGFDGPEAAGNFLSAKLSDLPDPFLIHDMGKAANRIADGVAGGEPIWIYTDFDADGVTSAALLALFFGAVGAKWRARLPRRDRDGYGLNAEILREIKEEGGGLVVTADCGIASLAEARLARELGLPLVITDHHTPASQLPEAEAVVNPKIEGSSYPDKMLAGVGVAWNLCAAVRKTLKERGWFSAERPEPDIKEYLDLVALGTIADLVPLVEVNRILVRAGIGVMNKNPRPGIFALAETAMLSSQYRAGHLAYQLAPRINAAGRMESPVAALDLLLADSVTEAMPLARQLSMLNDERRAEEMASFINAKEVIRQNGWSAGRLSLVVEGESYHAGVVGIVASRLVDKFGRPSVVIASREEICKGSARSMGGLDIHETLGDCADLLIAFGGHKGAAGITIERRNIPKFRERFEQAVKKRITEKDLAPSVTADTFAAVSEMTLPLLAELERLDPFGYGNPSPVILMENLLVTEAGYMGEGGKHLRLRLSGAER